MECSKGGFYGGVGTTSGVFGCTETFEEMESKLIHHVDDIVNTRILKWHPYPQEKPTENEKYLLTCEYKCCIGVTFGKWWDDEFCDIDEEGKVIAWAELPKAYEQSEGNV